MHGFERLGPPSISRGHQGGRYSVTIFANAAGARAFRAHADVMPRGAVFAAVHVLRSPSHAPGPVLAMKKLSARRHDWYFAFATAALTPLRQGKLTDCAACHATASHDDVFIVPR